MKDRIEKGHVFKGLKFFIFLVLLMAVILQYLVGIYDKFFNSSTTLVSLTTEAQDFTIAPLTICMDNGLKPTVLEKYGLESNFDFMFEMHKSNVSSVWDTFIEASYILDRQVNSFHTKNATNYDPSL
jgi:hypothetical protein